MKDFLEFTDLVLASASPRRCGILNQLGLNFRVVPSCVEETPKSKNPFEFPKENAVSKAVAVSLKEPKSLVMGFDTLVFLDNKPLGKPKNKEHALEMLLSLNNRSHFVITGVAISQNGVVLDTAECKTEVIFRNNTLQELKDYVNSNDPMDKAGAYGIQTHGARLVSSIHGCFYNVAGLPVACLLDLLKKLKVKV